MFKLKEFNFSTLGIFFIVLNLIILALTSAMYISLEREYSNNVIKAQLVVDEHYKNPFIIRKLLDNKTAEIPIISSLRYSKLTTSEVLGNSTRANIYELIANNPGINFGSITKELRISNGTAQYHLRVLERCDYVNSRRTGKHTRFYLSGLKGSSLSETQERIIQAVKDKPGISQSDIARELDISRQLVNYHVKKLIDKKVILVDIDSNHSSCFPLVEGL